MSTFDCGARDLGLGLRAGGRPPLLLLIGLAFPQLLFPLKDSPRTEVANVVVVGCGEKDRGRSRFEDGCADDETPKGHSSRMQKCRNSGHFILQ